MESKFMQTAGKFYFMVIAVLMYYFLTEVINVGLFVTYRHAFALVLAVSTFFAFLVKPNIARGVVAIKGAFVYALPMLVTFFASLFVWFVNRVEVDIMLRGLSSMFVYTNMLSFTLAAVAFLYVFGEKGIWYNLIAILISNMLMIITIIAQEGIVGFFTEFVTLIVTFAENTGDIIVKAEIHELAFCLGAYLIYMLLKPKKDIVFMILLALTSFCFLAAFKRIGVMAVAATIVVGWFLRFVAKYKKDTAMRLTVILTVLLEIFLIGYVWAIKLDIFSLIEEMGINTSGRVQVYSAVDKFYEFAPSFLGNGIGFLTYQLTTNMNVGVATVHNDFLQYFIDLGFWGYLLWLSSMFLVRVCSYGKNGKVDNAILTFSLSLYLAIASSTDNTMNFPLLTTVLAIIMIGHGFDREVMETEEKMFGYVSKVNKAAEGDTIL